MNKIYKKAKDVYIESTVLYPKDKSIYDDVTHDTQTTTDALKEAFLKDSVMDVTKGSYGNDSRTFINPISYSQSENVGRVGLMLPIIEPGKNKYPVYVEDDIANVTVGGENLGTVTTSTEPRFHTGNIRISNYTEATSVYLEFGQGTKLYSTLCELATDLYKKGGTIPYVTVSMKMGVYDTTYNNITVKMRAGKNTSPRSFTIPSSYVRADTVQIFSSYKPNLSFPQNIVKIEFPERVPRNISIIEIQVEIDGYYTDYEPYKIHRTMDPYYAESTVGSV